MALPQVQATLSFSPKVFRRPFDINGQRRSHARL
jgi:hypothetical protein